MTEGFHEKVFDEGTLTKLRIIELYAREWLPVFVGPRRITKREVHVFDFFAGPGSDRQGQLGSPLRLLRQLHQFVRGLSESAGCVHAHFFDKDTRKISLLRRAIDESRLRDPRVELDLQALRFHDALNRYASTLADGRAAKLLLIDQCGVDQVTPDVFRHLVRSPICDFLFFLSSSTLYRFRDHPAIKQKIVRPSHYYHAHRAALEYYRRLLTGPERFYLAPFSIKKGPNVYGLIFGSPHPLGMDKFLQVAWKTDEINGEADFDIGHDNVRPGELFLPLDAFRPTKVTAFERELEQKLRAGDLSNEATVIRLCFEHGVKRQHAGPVLAKLKDAGVVSCNFRVPQIERLRSPRPIRISR
jgi:three-Cys-motif partner protein